MMYDERRSHPVYEAKREILINRAKIIDANLRRDQIAVSRLMERNRQIRQDIAHRYAIIIDY